MKGQERKAAINAYKDRKVEPGVYAIRCAPSGEVWVGGWPDIDTIKTRIWFSLRQDTGAKPAMLAAWRQHGEPAFSFDVLERLPADIPEFARARRLKDRVTHWMAALSAEPA